MPLPDGAAGWANLGALLLYVGAYQLSFGPVSWLVVGEVRVGWEWALAAPRAPSTFELNSNLRPCRTIPNLAHPPT